LAAVLSLLLIGAAKHYESRIGELAAEHTQDVAQGKATTSGEDVQAQVRPLARRVVMLSRIGLALWIAGFVCLGLSISRRERGLQNATVIVLALAGLLQLLFV
jgi:hypothetical protein